MTWTDNLGSKLDIDRKRLITDVANARTLIENDGYHGSRICDRIRYDAFGDKYWFRNSTEWHEYTREAASIVQRHLHRWGNFPIGTVEEALLISAKAKCGYHPVKDYLGALAEPDDTTVLDTWLTKYLGAADTATTREIGKRFLISAVARIYQPGCQADHMLVLEGSQGIGKSSAVRALAGDWFKAGIGDLSNKDASLGLAGKWIIELDELTGFARKDWNSIKAFISKTVDNERKPYERVAVSLPRQCVFIGTTNDHEYLSDMTGARRFWCVACGAIDLDGLRTAKDGIWAAAVKAYKAGEAWHVTDKATLASLAEVAEQRRITDPWEDHLKPLVTDGGPWSTTQLLDHLMVVRATNGDAKRLAQVCRKLGLEPTQIISGRQRTKGWKRKSESAATTKTLELVAVSKGGSAVVAGVAGVAGTSYN